MSDRRLSTPRAALSTLTRRPRPAAVPRSPDRSAPQLTPVDRPARMVDNAVYAGGRRIATPGSPAESHEWLTEGYEDRMVWLGLYRPDPAALGELAEQYDLPELAVKEGVKVHQRPKVERYGDSLFVVLKAARYVEEEETVEFGEIHVFVGSDFIVTARHGEASELREVRRQLEDNPDLLRRGPSAVLYTIMDRVVEDYGPVADGLENDIDEIEVEVFEGTPGASQAVSRRIYELSREVIQFHQATQPLAGALGSLTQGDDIDPEVRRHLRDVHDHVLRVTERV